MDKRIAIVTGASRPKGIGAAICRELAQKGNHVFFTHLTPYDHAIGYEDADHRWAERFASELREKGVNVGHMNLDLTDHYAPQRLLDKVESELGKPTILVNNATHCEEVSYKELTADILAKHCAVNVQGTCMLTVEFAKRLEGTRIGGRIVNLVSGQDKSPVGGNLAYITSKGAISAFTRSLATELASEEITVNAIDPGPTNSGSMDHETQGFLKRKFPTGRIGTPEDAARLIGFLTSEEAKWVTGQIIHSDGGFRD